MLIFHLSTCLIIIDEPHTDTPVAMKMDVTSLPENRVLAFLFSVDSNLLGERRINLGDGDD
jgi:hypothetical protein